MKFRAIIGLVVVFATAGLAFGGCGDDDDATASLTKAQFTKQANAICARSDEVRKAEYRAEISASEGDKDLSDAEKERLFLDVFIVPFQEMIGELEDLGVPQGDEQELEAIFTEMKKGAEVLEEDPLLILGEPTMFKKANELNTKYGLTACVL